MGPAKQPVPIDDFPALIELDYVHHSAVLPVEMPLAFL
jgi:hypothetical protein